MAPRGEVQNKVYQYIKEYISAEGKAPTLAEISTALGIKSTPAVLFHLRALEKRGLIKRTAESRGITLIEELNFANIAVLGIANASAPLAAAEQSQLGYLQLDNRIIRNNGNLFAVKINGDSMNRQAVSSSNVLLRHGNYAIVDRAASYHQGDVVLAIVNGGATIKIYMETNDGVILLPNSTNQSHHPIYVKDREQLVINGKVVMALDRPNVS
jgi:repressor LexA